MKRKSLLLSIFYSLLQVQGMAQDMQKISGNIAVVFDGRTPCQDLAMQLNEKVRQGCTKIKWRLTLYKDPVTGAPGTYEILGFIYKRENPRTGNWRITRGTKANPEAVVYRLDHPTEAPIFLQEADENILFFLDKEKNLMVGNKDFSYTLNRINNRL